MVTQNKPADPAHKNKCRGKMDQQLGLELDKVNTVAPGVADVVSYDEIHVSRSTFLNGLANRVHRWFRLTPSFGPDLVQEMIERLEVKPNETVLDPFAGAGTTLIECKLEGRKAVGFEVNPLLHFVNEACLEWSVAPEALITELPRLQTELEKAHGVSIDDLEAHELSIPPIHNPTRWWRPDVLVELVFLRRAILATADPKLQRLLLLALAGVLVPDLSNVTLGKLQLHFIDRSGDRINVWETFSSHVTQISHDLKTLREAGAHHQGSARCYHQNSMDLSDLKLDEKISAVITSPPYPNRYSYVWNTRPHLYMLGLMTTPREAADLDKRTIGGTWGSATSELSKGIIEPINEAVATVVGPLASEIREQDNLMANYVMHYFNRLSVQIAEMDPFLTPDARLAYVVGNSRIKGVYVETDVLLGEIMERMGLGYKVFDVHRFRRRHSGVKLYESIVYAKK
jgi:DNA modification methylase